MTRLEGAVVVTTRAQSPHDPLARGLRAEAARVIAWPTLAFSEGGELGRLDELTARVHDFDWVVFTSARAVAPVVARVGTRPEGLRVAAVGPSTGRALALEGWRADLVGSGGATDLGRRMMEGDALRGRLLLLPVGTLARRTLEVALTRAGAVVERVNVYCTVCAPLDADAVRADLADGVDLVTFASPSALRCLARLLPDLPDSLAGAAVVTIGDTTTRAAREAGLRPAATAEPSTLAGLIDACARVWAGGGAR